MAAKWNSTCAGRFTFLPTQLRLLACAFLGLTPLLAGAQANAPGTITLQSLVERMVDRDAVAEFPGYANVTGEETSKDPRAREIAGYFYADDDGGNFQRDVVIDGRTEHVMADLTGPGAMTRFFIAGPVFTGHTIRFYLDGSTTPVLTSDLNTLMTGGSFVGAPFVYGAGKPSINTPYSGPVPPGLNFYLPIPFARQMLITYDGPDNVTPAQQDAPILDFVWEYERFTPETNVTSFTPSQFTSNQSTLAAYYNQLSAITNTTLPTAVAYTNSGATTFFNTTLAAHASATYALPSGANALRLLQANVGTSSAALSGIQLTINFDGDADAVDAPFGNFFGTGPTINPGTTQMQSVGSNGTMTSRWTMPWQSSASITITNTTTSALPVFLSGVVGPYTWDASSMHFHAYRRINGPQYMHNQIHTMRMIYIAGKGVFVGDNEVVVEAQPAGDTAPNWWGEGDELIYVDGAAFPTHRGTGSEDYFGYAFAHVYLFQSPWASQIAVAPQANPQPNPPVFNYDGTTVLNRNRLLDVIPFNDHFRYDFEIHNNNDANSDVEVDHTTFFYALPGSVSLIQNGPVNGQTYTIESKINGWNLTATPSGVTTDLKTNDGSQQFLATSLGNNVYTLKDTYYNLYLGASSNTSGIALSLAAYKSTNCEQQWTIVNVFDTGTAIPNPLGNGSNGYQSMINACNFSADVVNGATAAGTPVQQYSVTGTDSQYWRFNQWTGDAQLIPDGVYNINNVATNLFVDVPKGSKLVSQPLQVFSRDTQPSEQPAQQWTINYLGNGTYSILNVNSDLALDNSGTGINTTVDQFTWTTGSNMTWRIVPAGPGQFNIQNVDNGYYLSVGGNQTPGSTLIQQTLGGGADQLWSFLFVPGT